MCPGFGFDRPRSTSQQPGTKSSSRPANKPLIYRWPTADFVPAFGLDGILFRVSGETLGRRVVDASENTKVMNFKKWFDVPVLAIELTRMPNLKQALKG